MSIVVLICIVATPSSTPKSTPVIIKSQSRIQKSSGDDFGDDIPLSLEDMEQAMQGVEES